MKKKEESSEKLTINLNFYDLVAKMNVLKNRALTNLFKKFTVVYSPFLKKFWYYLQYKKKNS